MRLDMYEEVDMIFHSEEKDIILVRHALSNTLFIKKIIYDSNDAGVYGLLKEHTHPNIACIYEVDQQEHSLILIEEFINGVTLEYALSTHDFTYDEIANVMEQLMDAVEFLHHFEAPIIHRDLKPGNIMIADNRIKLIDFEIARLYKEQQGSDTRVVGSPGFAAPEQYGFQQSDERSDIYALGTVLKCLCEHSDNHILAEEKFSAIIKRCMQLDPVNRYQKIYDMRKAFPSKKSKSFIPSQKEVLGLSSIPGFANETREEKIFIFLYYVFILYMAISIEIKNPASEFHVIMMKIAVFIMLLGYLWIPKNVGRILEMLPLYGSPYKIIRVLNGILIWFILAIFVLLIMALLSIIMESML